MTDSKAAAFSPGDVFVSSDGRRMRRVIAVVDRYVRYSSGGDTNRTCRLRTFKRFLKTAVLSTDRGGGEL